MERLTERLENGVINVKYASQHETAIHRLVTIEDILGDEYDLDRLRELAQADREGRCVVLPVKPGGLVIVKGNPSAKPEKVECINIYSNGKITFSFHEYGVKETFVDEWSEDESEKYISVSDSALRREQKKKEKDVPYLSSQTPIRP